MVTVLAMQIFLGHKERIDALEATPRETEESRAELAGALRKALNFGQLYLKSNPNPDWAILRPMLDYRMELEDVDGTLRLLSTMEGLFGQKPSGREKLIKWVIPEVVDFLLKRKEFNRAAPLVEKMLQRKSYPQEVRWNAIKFYAGWLVVENGQVKEVNGHGPIEKAYQALEGGESLIELLYKPYQSADSQFTQGWYRVVAQYSYVYLQAGAEDTALFEKAKKFVSKVKGIDNFKKIIEHPRLSELEQKKLDELGPEEKKKKLAEYEAEREELYKIFQYLARKLGV